MNKTASCESQAWELDAARLVLSAGIAGASAPQQPTTSLDDSGQKLADFLARNGFPLLGLPDSVPLFRTSEMSRARTGEAAEFGRLRGEFEVVRQTWKSHGIECLMLKSVGAPPDFPYKSGNLDVLVPHGRGAPARRLLLQLGYVELRNLEEPNKFLFRRFRDGDAACDVHLHLRIEWRVSFLFEDQVWNRRQGSTDEPSLFVPSPEDALLINLAHAFFENKSFGLYDLKKIEHCLGVPGLQWGYIWMVAESKGWHTGLASALLIHDHLVSLLLGRRAVPGSQLDKAWAQLGRVSRRSVARLLHEPMALPFPIGFIFSKRLFVQKTLTDGTEAPRDRFRDLLLHFATGARLKLGVRSQPGFLVTLSGVDGAGKTTQARSLSRAFERCAIRTKYVWSRPGSSLLASRLIQPARALVHGLRHPSAKMAGQDPTRLGRRGQDESGFDPNNWLHRAVWLSLVLLDCALVFGVRVRLARLAGHVVICDRYLPDAFADLASRFRNEAAAKHPILRLIARLCPKPDFAALLRVDPGQARNRQELQPGRHSGGPGWVQARVLEALAEHNRATVLDASRDRETVSDQLVFGSLTRYFSGYRTLLNRVFFSNPRSAPDSCEPASIPPEKPLQMPYQGNGPGGGL